MNPSAVALDGRVACRPALAVDAAPGAERRELERDRPIGPDETVHDTDRRPPVGHRQLALEHDVTELPAPARDAVVELERDEVPVPAGSTAP